MRTMLVSVSFRLSLLASASPDTIASTAPELAVICWTTVGTRLG